MSRHVKRMAAIICLPRKRFLTARDNLIVQKVLMTASSVGRNVQVCSYALHSPRRLQEILPLYIQVFWSVMWMNSHGLQPVIWIAKLSNDQSVAFPTIACRVGRLKPVLVPCQMVFHKKRMIETVGEVTAKKNASTWVSGDLLSFRIGAKNNTA